MLNDARCVKSKNLQLQIRPTPTCGKTAYVATSAWPNSKPPKCAPCENHCCSVETVTKHIESFETIDVQSRAIWLATVPAFGNATSWWQNCLAMNLNVFGYFLKWG